MFTSCCPGWINYVEQHEPRIMDYLSTNKSPQAVFGAMAKKFLPEKLGIARENLRVISIMPCTAKKGEAARPNLTQDGTPDVDMVLTVRELARLIRRGGLHLRDCEESEFDTDLFTTGSGAAVIFGTTGGVMEAAVRTLYALTHGGETLQPLVYTPARGLDGVKESVVNLGDLGDVRLAIVHGMGRTQDLIKKMAAGDVAYDFVEVMACPGGCISGGGNPRKKNNYQSAAVSRQEGLYQIDANAPLRESHKNPQVQAAYAELFGEPGSHLAHELLHCEYRSKKAEAADFDVHKLWQKINQR
ncbi:MAG: iron hydrogenase small subunit, partial [Burkholderiaceae bacterium]|nr:iron hydrogenase small subunit [Burkholderiaceae bacterium]